MEAKLQFLIESCGDTFKLEINLLYEVEDSTDLIGQVQDVYFHIERYAEQHRTLNNLITYVESIPNMTHCSLYKGITQGKDFTVIEHCLKSAVRSHFISAIKSIEIVITHNCNSLAMQR